MKKSLPSDVLLNRTLLHLSHAYGNLLKISRSSILDSGFAPLLSRCQLNVSEVYIALFNLLRSYENKNSSSSPDGPKSND